MNKLTALIAMMAAGATLAAEPGVRTHPDPECLKRDADPEKCVIQDGPPPPPRVRQRVEIPQPAPPPKKDVPQPGAQRRP